MKQIVLILVLSMPALTQAADYGGGSGTPEDPYQIWTPQQLNTIGDNPGDWRKAFKLMANINMSDYTGTQYKRIGTSTSNPFMGSFDGNGHVIQNLTYQIAAVQDYVGMFGAIRHAIIKDLGLVNANILSEGQYVGGLIGLQYSGVVSRCFVTGSVSSTNKENVGGFIGFQYGPVNMEKAIVEDCYCSGVVTCTGVHADYVGGFAGQAGGWIRRCYSTSEVIGEGNFVGGFAGWGSKVINSFWDVETSQQISSSAGKGRDTEQMKQASNYIGWNKPMELKWILHAGNDYPRLAWEETPGNPLSSETLNDFLPGTGTPTDPFRVEIADSLNMISLFESSNLYFLMTSDIDLSTYPNNTFNTLQCFEGFFDGAGHTVRNFTYITEMQESCRGLFGSIYGGTILNLSLEKCLVSSAGDCIGGLVGFSQKAAVQNCKVDNVEIKGTGPDSARVGGLVGFNLGSVVSCCSSGNVFTSHTSSSNIGGLVGRNGGLIENSYTSCRVYGHGRNGGLAGFSWGYIKNSYSTGYVGHAGGFVGYNSGTIVDSFWNIETSGTTDGVGNQYPDPTGVTGQTTTQMTIQSTFAGWDFSTPVWTML